MLQGLPLCDTTTQNLILNNSLSIATHATYTTNTYTISTMMQCNVYYRYVYYKLYSRRIDNAKLVRLVLESINRFEGIVLRIIHNCCLRVLL